MVVFYGVNMNSEDKIHECGTVLIDMLNEIDKLKEKQAEFDKKLEELTHPVVTYTPWRLNLDDLEPRLDYEIDGD